MFFTDERFQFFRPLTSKYREQAVECLRLFYSRLYGANADYGESLRREQVIEIFEEALVRAPLLDSDDSESDTRFKSEREQAGWLLNLLVEHGWIDKRVDSATLQTTYPFTRMGRLFTQPLVEADATRIRTRHRNTRNTLNALEAFLNRGEVHDLLDAYEYSERIISDFTDVIAELEDRKRALVKEVESQLLVQQATDQFFEFMEKRFQPDLSVRLSADSVEKHREQINKAVARVRRKRKETKRDIELRLRDMVPELIEPGRSLLMHILDTIEYRMRVATETMLPALRRALQSFTKRADIIIRQLSYISYQQHNDVLSVCQQLAQLPPDAMNERLAKAGETLAELETGFIDPASVKIVERQRQQAVQTRIEAETELDETAHRDLFIQQLLDSAFSINDKTVRDYVVHALRNGRRIATSEFNIDSAEDLLAVAHAIEIGAVNQTSSDYRFRVEPTGTVASNEYYDAFDQFYIELMDNDDTA